ncbi:MAG: hypothetical protein ACXW4H_00655 [Candidatus Limnocylindrales bacterium]
MIVSDSVCVPAEETAADPREIPIAWSVRGYARAATIRAHGR